MNKKMCIIADLHLAIAKAFDNFGIKKIELFRKFAEALLKSGVEILIFAGDIFELWQGKGGNVKKIRIIQERYKEFFDIIDYLKANGVEIIFLYGNHDSYCKNFFNWPRYYNKELNIYNKELNTTVGKVGVHVEHGDRFDKIPTWLGKLAASIFAVIEGVCGPKIQNWFDELIAYRTPSSKKYKGKYDEYLKGANSILKKMGKKYVQSLCIFGHTHMEIIHNLIYGIYINCGTLINDLFDYVLISYPVLNIEVKKYKGGVKL